MFTSVEIDYLKGLLNVYASQGYKYYVAHTVNETDDENDFKIYLSKEKIISNRPNSFEIPDNSIVITVDSSARNDNNYNPSLHSRDYLSNYHGNLTINIAEFIYTNSEVSYDLITYELNPDIMLSGVDSHDTKLLNYGLLFVAIAIFLYMFIKSILRIRR